MANTDNTQAIPMQTRKNICCDCKHGFRYALKKFNFVDKTGIIMYLLYGSRMLTIRLTETLMLSVFNRPICAMSNMRPYVIYK